MKLTLTLLTVLPLLSRAAVAAPRSRGESKPPAERLELGSTLPIAEEDATIRPAGEPIESWSEEKREQVSPAANKAFFRMMDIWSVNNQQAASLLGVSPERLAQLKSDPKSTLDHEHLIRVGHLLGIFRSLNTIFSDDLADRWLQMPNKGPLFKGKTPLAHMVEGGLPAMEELRRYIDAVRWGN